MPAPEIVRGLRGETVCRCERRSPGRRLLRLGHQPRVAGARGQEDQAGAEERDDAARPSSATRSNSTSFATAAATSTSPAIRSAGLRRPRASRTSAPTVQETVTTAWPAVKPVDVGEISRAALMTTPAAPYSPTSPIGTQIAAREASGRIQPSRPPATRSAAARARTSAPAATAVTSWGIAGAMVNRTRVVIGASRWIAAIQAVPPSTSAVIIAKRLRSPTATSAATRASPRTARTAGEPSRPTTVAVSRAVTAATPAATLTARAPGSTARTASTAAAPPARSAPRQPPSVGAATSAGSTAAATTAAIAPIHVRALAPVNGPVPRARRRARSSLGRTGRRSRCGVTRSAGAARRIAQSACGRSRSGRPITRISGGGGATSRGCGRVPVGVRDSRGRCGRGRDPSKGEHGGGERDKEHGCGHAHDGEHRLIDGDRVHPVQDGACRGQQHQHHPPPAQDDQQGGELEDEDQCDEEPAVGEGRREDGGADDDPAREQLGAPAVGEPQAGTGDDQREQQGGERGK